MKLGMEVSLGPGHIVLDLDPAPSKKGHNPQCSAHVRFGQTAGLIKIPLGTEVGLSSGDFVLDGDPAPPKKGAHPPIFVPYLLLPNRRPSQLLLSTCRNGRAIIQRKQR